MFLYVLEHRAYFVKSIASHTGKITKRSVGLLRNGVHTHTLDFWFI